MDGLVGIGQSSGTKESAILGYCQSQSPGFRLCVSANGCKLPNVGVLPRKLMHNHEKKMFQTIYCPKNVVKGNLQSVIWSLRWRTC